MCNDEGKPVLFRWNRSFKEALYLIKCCYFVSNDKRNLRILKAISIDEHSVTTVTLLRQTDKPSLTFAITILPQSSTYRSHHRLVVVCASEYQFYIDPDCAHAPMSATETDGVCEWGLFECSKLTCDLGFDGWKDCWLESVRRGVNRGMNSRSNRLEECERLSCSCVPTGTSRIRPMQRGSAFTWILRKIPSFFLFPYSGQSHFSGQMNKRPPFFSSH